MDGRWIENQSLDFILFKKDEFERRYYMNFNASDFGKGWLADGKSINRL